MGPALEKAGLALHEAFAARKHMIVLTDGISDPADFATISRKIAGWGVTISTVALGPEASRPLLANIADIGRGRAYVCDDPNRMPEIFARENRQRQPFGNSRGARQVAATRRRRVGQDAPTRQCAAALGLRGDASQERRPSGTGFRGRGSAAGRLAIWPGNKRGVHLGRRKALGGGVA